MRSEKEKKPMTGVGGDGSTDTEKPKTVMDLLGRRMFGVEFDLDQIDKISVGIEAIGDLYRQMNDADWSEEGCGIDKKHRLMDGLYGCLEILGSHARDRVGNIRARLGIEMNDGCLQILSAYMSDTESNMRARLGIERDD